MEMSADQDTARTSGRLERSRPDDRVRYVKWYRESGDWVGDTSQTRRFFRIERRAHGIYLVTQGVREQMTREQMTGTLAAKAEAEARARNLGCTPMPFSGRKAAH